MDAKTYFCDKLLTDEVMRDIKSLLQDCNNAHVILTSSYTWSEKKTMIKILGFSKSEADIIVNSYVSDLLTGKMNRPGGFGEYRCKVRHNKKNLRC